MPRGDWPARIVPMFDVGEDEGLPFLVMEFINGQTLADAVKKGERLTLERLCEIGQQIAEALRVRGTSTA